MKNLYEVLWLIVSIVSVVFTAVLGVCLMVFLPMAASDTMSYEVAAILSGIISAVVAIGAVDYVGTRVWWIRQILADSDREDGDEVSRKGGVRKVEFMAMGRKGSVRVRKIRRRQ